MRLMLKISIIRYNLVNKMLHTDDNLCGKAELFFYFMFEEASIYEVLSKLR